LHQETLESSDTTSHTGIKASSEHEHY